MKKCPQCQSIYTDDTLSYCLSDGTTLIFNVESSETTLQIPENAVTGAMTMDTQASPGNPPDPKLTAIAEPGSKVWIYSTIGLLLILITGGGIGIGVWLNGPNSGTGKDSVAGNQSERTESARTPSPTPGTYDPVQTSPTVPPGVKNTPKPIQTRTPIPNEATTPSLTPRPAESGYRVVGVASHDVLYLRPDPGNLKSFLARIPPGAVGIQVVGSGVKVGKATWYPVIYDGKRGWVNGRFIARN